MALDILTKGPIPDWTEDNQLYGCFKAWRKSVGMLTTGMALKKELQEFICHCIKAWFGEMDLTHITVTAYKQLDKGTLVYKST